MKHADLEPVDILDFKPPFEVATMLRRQFPANLRRRLLFEVRAWEDQPWIAIYIMERNEPANLVLTWTADVDMARMSTHGWQSVSRHMLGRKTSKLLDVYSMPLVDRPRRYKNRIVTRATVDPVLKGWVMVRI